MITILADAYFHNLDPFAIQFTPTIGLRWYGLSYAMGFLLAWWIVRRIARKSWSPIPPQASGDLMFAVILGVLIGGRLGYALFYERGLFTSFSKSLPYWDLLAINKGGMASHGGMIGVIVACWWFGRKRNISSLHILDVGSLACTPGLFFGRLANFINAELWGKPIPANLQTNSPWWSVKYPEEILNWTETLTAPADPRLAQLAPLQSLVPQTDAWLYHIIALAKEGHAQVVQTLKPLLTAYYPSQLLQALTDGPILLGLLILLWLKPRKPGVIGSWFLIIYGVLRILTEVFRQPDAGVALTFGLSRGQLLSLLMTLAGVICLIVASRRSVPRIGGLFHESLKSSEKA